MDGVEELSGPGPGLVEVEVAAGGGEPSCDGEEPGEAEEGDPGQVESAGKIRVARGGKERKHERESGTEQKREPWGCFCFVVEELPIHGQGAVT